MLPLLVLTFVACGFGLMASWGLPDSSLAAGDEPHYLLLADGMVHDASLSPAQAYVRDAREAAASIGVVPDADRVLQRNAIHLVHGPRDWYSVHAVGLSAVIAPAAAVAHEFGARMVLVVLGSSVVVLLWMLARRFVERPGDRLLTIVPLAFALPVLASTTQIYPDLPGGVLCLLGLAAIARAEDGATTGQLLPSSLALALLPWLHLRFAVPAALLVAALTFAHARAAARRPAVWLAVPLLFSAALVAVYNVWAFGAVSGPYGGEAVSVSWRSAMVLIGLGVDQNQGLLMQQPLHLVGLAFLVAFLRDRPLMGWCMIGVVAAILLPSAAHPAWYGGPTFSGRFGWAPSLALMPATVFGLGRLARIGRRWFLAVTTLGCAIQFWYLSTAFGGATRLFQRPETTPLDRYSIHFGSLGRWLPAWYDPNMALGHVPNAVALLVVGWTVALGAWWSSRSGAGRRVGA